jgi:hypothetical protein
MLTEDFMDARWVNLATALAIGLLLGMERERAKGEGPERGAATDRPGPRDFQRGSLARRYSGAESVSRWLAVLRELTGSTRFARQHAHQDSSLSHEVVPQGRNHV